MFLFAQLSLNLAKIDKIIIILCYRFYLFLNLFGMRHLFWKRLCDVIKDDTTIKLMSLSSEKAVETNFQI